MKNEDNNHKLTVRFPLLMSSFLHKKLGIRAVKDGLSRSALARKIIAKYLSDKK